MDKFYIIANSEKDEGLRVSKKVADYLKSQGKSCMIQPENSQLKNLSAHYTDISRIRRCGMYYCPWR